MAFHDKFAFFRKRGKNLDKESEEKYLDLTEQDPENDKAHLKLAEIYEKRGEIEKSFSEYLQVADIFAKKNFYAGAMAIYKKLVKQDPTADHVYLKIADIYRKMGFLEDALAQYRALVEHYESLGKKDKAAEVMKIMAQMNPRKAASKENTFKSAAHQSSKGKEARPEAREATLERFFDLRNELKAAEPLEVKVPQEVSTLEKLYGIQDVFKELKDTSGPSAVDPDFNCDLGMAYAKAGFLDDAIEQLQAAIAGGQKPFEAASALGSCYKKKALLEEACQSFEKALRVGGIPREKKMSVKYELGLLYKELGRREESLDLLREVATFDQEVRYGKDEAAKPAGADIKSEANPKEEKKELKVS